MLLRDPCCLLLLSVGAVFGSGWLMARTKSSIARLLARRITGQ